MMILRSDNEYFWQMKILKNHGMHPVKVFQQCSSVVGSEKSTLSCCAIRGSGERRSSLVKILMSCTCLIVKVVYLI